jgi:hypothetical protein
MLVTSYPVRNERGGDEIYIGGGRQSKMRRIRKMMRRQYICQRYKSNNYILL